MAEWTASYINDLPDSAFACIDDGGSKDGDGKTTPRSLRHYPHHDAGGALDLPHLRNALSRVAQDDTTTCGVSHLRAHARAADVGGKSMTMAVKRVGENTIEGLAIPYGGTFAGKDLVGEAFDAKTDLCIEWFGRGGRPLLYDHGLDGKMKTSLVGRQDDYEERAEGLWAQSQLDLNRQYRQAIDRLIEEEALGYSSGAMPHLATKDTKTGILKRWPWVELSLTPIPAEPSTLGVHYTKSARDALDLLERVDVEIPPALRAAVAALDEWAETRDEPRAGKSYADDYERLLLDVSGFVDRSGDLAELRMKSGRVLSAANRERLTTLRERIASASDHASVVLKDLDELLAATDPEASKALWSATFEALAAEARALGANVTSIPNGGTE